MEKECRVEERIITRRDFVKGALCGALGITLGLSMPGNTAKAADAMFPAGSVILVRDGKAVDNAHSINAGVLYEMIRTAAETFGAKDMGKSWQLSICPLDMLDTEHPRRRAARTRSNVKIIHAVIMPLERYTDLMDDAGFDKAWQKCNFGEGKKLIIVDALRLCSGLHDSWNYKGIIVGDDPAAVSAVCHRIYQTSGNWPVDPGSGSVVVTIDTEYSPQIAGLPRIKSMRVNRGESALV